MESLLRSVSAVRIFTRDLTRARKLYAETLAAPRSSELASTVDPLESNLVSTLKV